MYQFYIYDNHLKKGPFSLEQLKAMALDGETLVWHPAISAWTTAESIEALGIQSAADRQIKVIIADDHVLYRAGVRAACSAKKDIRFLSEAENGRHLLQLLKSMRPDVILLDIQMPVMDGIATLPEIKKAYPGIKVIMLTMMDDQSMIRTLMALGANSYLTKMSDAEIIYQTIKTCYEQGVCFNSFTDRVLACNSQPPPYPPTKVVTRSQRETVLHRDLNQTKSIRTVRQLQDSKVVANDSIAGIALKTYKAGSVRDSISSRQKILDSFKDAVELTPPKKKIRINRAIVDSILITGILTALYHLLQSYLHP